MVYEKCRFAVDPVIFTVDSNELVVLLHEREKPPFKGLKELPGGLLREDEMPRERAEKKLVEITGKEDIFLEEFQVFADPGRDPRERTISLAFVALISRSRIEDRSRWFSARDLPETAFDHGRIIEEAEKYLKENLDHMLAREFMPEKFPLNRLQDAYEAILEKEFDNRNFRRRMKSKGIVESTGEKQEGVAHRPAELYRFT